MWIEMDEVKRLERIQEILGRLAVFTSENLGRDTLTEEIVDALGELFKNPSDMALIGDLSMNIARELDKHEDFRILKACWLRLSVECGSQLGMCWFATFFAKNAGSVAFQDLFRILDPGFGDSDDYFGFAERDVHLVSKEKETLKADRPIMERTKREAKSGRFDTSAIVILDGIDCEDDSDPRHLYKELALKPVPLKTLDELDLHRINTVLIDEFPWFSDVIRHIVQQLVFRAHGDNVFGFRPMLMVGSPGIGKTRFIRRLSELAGVPWRLVGLAGRADNRDICGTARGWNSACPGIPIRTIAEERIANPIILLDEIDKSGGSYHNGRVHDALIPLLERSSASIHQDEFLQARTDLSHISWLATANSIATLPAPLLSRFQVVRVSSPESMEDFKKIIKITVEEFAGRYGIRDEFMPHLGSDEMMLLKPFMKNPRCLAKATEHLLTLMISKPVDGRVH